jgi:hypothetical protein
VRMLSCLVRSLECAPLKDESVSLMANAGGTGSVLCSCVSAMCLLFARVCSMCIAAEMIPQGFSHQHSIVRLLARVRDTLSEAAKVTCFSVAIACGGGTVYRDIVTSTHRTLQSAQLPIHLCKSFTRSFYCCISFFPYTSSQLKPSPLSLPRHCCDTTRLLQTLAKDAST